TSLHFFLHSFCISSFYCRTTIRYDLCSRLRKESSILDRGYWIISRLRHIDNQFVRYNLLAFQIPWCNRSDCSVIHNASCWIS
ncbi:hypothetical protein PMAYCL1PPCAC_01412, partial [Pristionchus mayeri]